MSNFAIVINAGGKSTRMGTDKALLNLGGKPLIEHILEQTLGLGDQIIVTNTPDRYAYLGLPMATDILPDKGALGGLYTCLQAATRPYALVLACDMPLVNRSFLEYMMALASQFEAVVPRIATPSRPPPNPPDMTPHSDTIDGGFGGGVRRTEGAKLVAEPLRAIYSKACLDPIRRALDAGKMRMISFLPDVKLRWVEEDEIRQFDPELLTFRNCNTPEEFEELKMLWEQLKNKRQA
jgi:molybdopterin-guanine dinucleotide biosynthesis protein A